MSFTQFYQDGGVFMHVITLFALVASGLLLRRIGTIRRTFRDPNEQRDRLRRGDALTPALITACVLAGVLSSGLGWISVHEALRTVPHDQWLMAASMGAKIATYPLVWSLLCALPLVLGHGVLRHFEQRLRVLIERHA